MLKTKRALLYFPFRKTKNAKKICMHVEAKGRRIRKPWNCLSDYSERAEMPGVCASRRVLCIANDTSGGRGIGFFVRIICSLQAWSSAKTHGIMFSPWKKKLAPDWTIHLPTRKVHYPVHIYILFNPRFFSSSNRTVAIIKPLSFEIPRRCWTFEQTLVE